MLVGATTITETQKAEIRRHLGYPEPTTGLNEGGPPYNQSFGVAGAHIGDRYTPEFYDLEYRLISLSETANVEILGGESQYFALSIASAEIVPIGASPNPGEVLTIVVAGAVVQYTIQPGDTVAKICAGIAALIAEILLPQPLFVAAPFSTYTLVSAVAAGPLGNAIPLLAFGSPSVALAVQDVNANPCTTLRGGSEPPGPRYVDPATGLTVYGHLPICRFWETGIANASQNFDTLAAGDWKVDPTEYPKRRLAYVSACKDMAQSLAVVYYGLKSYRGNQGPRRVY